MQHLGMFAVACHGCDEHAAKYEDDGVLRSEFHTCRRILSKNSCREVTRKMTNPFDGLNPIRLLAPDGKINSVAS